MFLEGRLQFQIGKVSLQKQHLSNNLKIREQTSVNKECTGLKERQLSLTCKQTWYVP